MTQLFTSGGQSIGASASQSVLPKNTQDGSPLGWTGWISLQSKGLSRVFSNTTVNSLALSSLYSPNLTSIHDYWKNHSLDQMDLCWQSNVSAFYICICMVKSLCCPLETITTLLIGYTPTQNNRFIKKQSKITFNHLVNHL